jgi:hypothetical protein
MGSAEQHTILQVQSMPNDCCSASGHIPDFARQITLTTHLHDMCEGTAAVLCSSWGVLLLLAAAAAAAAAASLLCLTSALEVLAWGSVLVSAAAWPGVRSSQRLPSMKPWYLYLQRVKQVVGPT